MRLSIFFSIKIIVLIFLLSLHHVASASTHHSGATLGKFSVNSSGASSYAVDLQVPPGTAGMQPSLSLNYSSSGGNGLLGMGWSLGGLSVISRCPASQAQDGHKGGIGFDVNDRLCLDGQRLVAVQGAYGQSGTEYRVQNDNTSRIISYGQAGNGPAYFKVWTKGGQIMEYGIVETGLDARIEAQGKSDVLIWPIGRISDTVGNYITFDYIENNATGEHYINRIDYAGNSNTGVVPNAAVTFNYESRSDIKTGFVSGSLITISNRLTSIKTFAAGVQAKEYKLSYDYGLFTKRSRLLSLTECSSDDKCKLSSQFVFQDSTKKLVDNGEWVSGAYAGWSEEATSKTRQMDVNGDGLQDIMLGPDAKGQWFVLKNTGSSFVDEGAWLSGAYGGWAGSYNRIRSMEVNGDGLPDIVIGPNDRGEWFVLRNTGSSFVDEGAWVSGAYGGWTGSFNRIRPMDVNGDGLQDIVIGPNANGQWFVMKNTGSSFVDEGAWVSGAYAGWADSANRIRPMDVNADGQQDIVIGPDANGKWFVLKSTGSSFVDEGAWVSGAYAGWSDSTNRIRPMDVNGDGQQDMVIGPDANGQWFVLKNTGSSFVDEGAWVSGAYAGWANSTNRIRPMDVNGDGQQDIVIGPDANGQWFVMKNTGSSFVDEGAWASGAYGHWDGASNRIRPMDVNGDGLQDIVIGPDANGKWYVVSNAGGSTDKIIRITNGLGDQIDINYDSLANKSVYTKGTDAIYPVVDVQSPSYVVSRYSRSDGKNSLYHYDYHYEDLKSHTLGYGSLGFKKVTMMDKQKGVNVTTTYSQGLVYDANNTLVLDASGQPVIDQTQGKIRLLETRLDDGTLLESTAASWAVTTLTSTVDANKRFIIHKTSTVDEKHKLLGGLASRITTSYEFENQGTEQDYSNVSKVTIEHNDNHKKVTSNVFTNTISANLWHIGRLTSASVTNTTSYGESATRTSAFAYDANTGLLNKEVVEPGHPTHEKMTTYTYDDYGNKTSVSISAPGVATRTATTTYDTRGQFPIKSSNALSQAETYTYDARWGAKTSLTGPNGLTTRWEYDSLGRQIKEVRADGTFTSISYNLCKDGPACPYGSPLWITKQTHGNDPSKPDGSVPTTVYFDPLGREVRTATQGFDGRVIEKLTEYNAFGQADKISQLHYVGDAHGWTLYEFDVLGRMTKETKPDQSVTTVSYDGLKTTHTNDQGQSKTEIKDLRGKIIQVVDAVGSVSTYDYDPFGNLVSTIDNVGNETRMTYDITGKKASMTDLDMGYWVYGYNALGELVCQRDANNARNEDSNCLDDVNSTSGPFTSFMSYDKLGRMTQRVEKEGTTTWTYDTATNGIGKLHKSYSASSVSTTNSYDAFGRPLNTVTVIDGQTFESQIAYDPIYGRVQSKTFPSGFAIKNVYNTLGFLTEVRNAANDSPYWRMDNMNATGKVVAETLGNGISTLTHYNSQTERLEGIITGNSGSIQHLSYEFNSVGNMVNRADANQGINESFEFDELNRLVKSVMGSQVNTVAYDTIGNITHKSGVGAYTYNPNSPHAVIVAGTANYGYDYNGNMTSGDGRTLTYTSFNKPQTITRGSTHNTYIYDADHNRIKKISLKSGATTTTYYMGKAYEKSYLPSGVQEQKHYIDAGGVTIVYTKRSNDADTTQYLHKDHLGSTDVMTDVSGTIVPDSRASFDAWGARRNTNWTDTGDFGINITGLVSRGFTGHEHDDGVGLINMNARLYDAKLGRFLTPDTFVQFPYSTQGMNRYTYVNNNPISYTDPSGHFVATLFAFVVKLVVNAIISRVITAVIGAIAGPNSDLAKALNTIVAIYMGGDFIQTVATNYGGEKVQRFMQVVQFGQMVASSNGQANRISAKSVGNVAMKAIAGGAVSKLGGEKFANGAVSGAFSAMEESTSESNGSNDSEVNNLIPINAGEAVFADGKNIGPSREIYDGLIVIAKHGSPSALVSDAELAQVESDFDLIFSKGGDKGKLIQSKLSVKNPLYVLLNNRGGNAAYGDSFILTVDLNTELYFNSRNSSSPKRFSTTRIIVHETIHAVLGYDDETDITVKFADSVMSGINGSVRGNFNNACNTATECK